MRKTLTIIGIILFVAIIIATVGYVCSNGLQTEKFEIKIKGAPSFIVAHLSDLHYPHNSVSLGEILGEIKSIKPHYIALTGDIIDDSARERDLDAVSDFFRALSDEARCFLVIGNHEIGSVILDEFLLAAKNNNVTVLLNETKTVEKDGKSVCFVGLSDAYAYDERVKGHNDAKHADVCILLAHRPEKLEEYATNPIRSPDLILSGHAHGGLLRIGNTAFYAPNQGLFPKYTSGLYEKNTTKMVVSRGLGVSGVDYRFFNKYHIPVVYVSR